MTDNDILFLTGKYRLTWVDSQRQKRIIKRYNIDPLDPKPGLIDYMTHDTVPIMKDEDEFIHRKDWNLNSLVGETEGQLLHQDYYKLYNNITDEHISHHPILSIFQCSSKKPYTENRLLKYHYFQYFKDLTDFACISNPGIIPIEYCGYYPYRYDEWNVMAEDKLSPQIQMPLKYRIVNMCRFIRYVKAFDYKDVVVMIGNPKKQWIFDEMIKYNICNCRDWLHIVTDDNFRTQLFNNPTYSKLVKQGILSSRISNLTITRETYENTLNDIYDQYKQSNKANISTFITGIDINTIYKKYRVKPDENELYRNCYWTVLDLILENTTVPIIDIDKLYWEKFNELKQDNNYIQLDDTFIFIKKEFKDNIDEIREDVYRLKLIKDDAEFQLKPSIFKFLDKKDK